jgi:hypothetical protein
MDVCETGTENRYATGDSVAKKIVSAVLGIVAGLFVGIIILGTLIRVTFSSIFGWGDSALVMPVVNGNMKGIKRYGYCDASSG